ncbi:flagellar hook-associated protein FlgK [Microterricola viridarii]|uniref:Flagellar hook-associated protein 1 n=1 Tax=Microterricola viridarii TaxID=412690 RepID=A0A1H1W6I1_9MICO|nr:flagellar hook-associated protein FlgK [Microterricola viridarii]SDS92582.1 flagellar hook-associated protein 1 FlgK [Microterricola viridarii]
MSTFSGLNTAYRGLSAAKAGIDVAGQNIANSRTEGYTRQRLNTSAIGGPSMAGKFSVGVRPGGGVNIDGIARLGDMHLDARVRASAAVSGFSAVRAGVFSDLESALHEPGANGISTQLQSFWASWQELSNSPGEATQSGLLLQQSQVLAQQISSTYTEFDNQWSQVRGEVRDLTAELNGAAAQLADLNGRIRQATAAGGSVNELLDQRSLLATTIAAIAGGTIRDAGDGTIDVYIGGNALVTGTTARTVNVIGSNTMAGSDTSPVTLEWAHRPGSAISLDGGELAGAVSTLAPAAAGGGIAKAAESLNNFAQKLADAVNTVHRTGFSAGGSTNLEFFAFTAGKPAAQGLTVVPTSAAGIATAGDGQGALDGSIADAISQLGTGAGSPDSVWSSFVVELGIATRSEIRQADLAALATTSAVGMQLANASVDIDEENVSLLMYQHAYQGAARVMTAVDEMLDVLINRTGLVGR